LCGGIGGVLPSLANAEILPKKVLGLRGKAVSVRGVNLTCIPDWVVSVHFNRNSKIENSDLTETIPFVDQANIETSGNSRII
jgi:hypothetical protein